MKTLPISIAKTLTMARLLAFALLPSLTVAQNENACCCCEFRDKGQSFYYNDNLKEAVKKWEKGKKCSDAKSCPDLDGLIAKANNLIAKQKNKSKKPASTPTPSREADNAAWDMVKESTNPKDVQNYLNKYPNGLHIKEAKDRLIELEKIDDVAWEIVKESTDPQTLQNYIDKYPNGRHATEARQKIKDMAPVPAIPLGKNEQADDDYWESVKDSTESKDIQRYLDKYPNGRHASEARDRLFQLDDNAWNRVKDSGNIDSIQGYLAKYPNGRHVEDANTKRLAVEKADDEYWNRVKNSEDAKIIKGYLDEYPDGRHFKEAKARFIDFFDQDEDGIVNKNDHCPHEPGSAERSGCPPVVQFAPSIDFTIGFDVYQWTKIPNDTYGEGHSVGSIGTLFAGPKIFLTSKTSTIQFALDAGANFSPWGLDVSKYRGMGVLSFPVFAEAGLRFKDEDILGGPVWGFGYQYTFAELYFPSEIRELKTSKYDSFMMRVGWNFEHAGAILGHFGWGEGGAFTFSVGMRIHLVGNANYEN